MSDYNKDIDEQIEDLIGNSVFGREWVQTGHPENFEAGEVNISYLEREIKALINQKEKEARIAENDYHWHRQKAIEAEAKKGMVSKYFLDRIKQLKEELKEGEQ